MKTSVSKIDKKFILDLLKKFSDKHTLDKSYPKNYRYRYINNNYVVSVNYNRLTKRAFRIGEELVSDFPDSIDLKITNKCSNSCPYCHESSVADGKSFDIDKTEQILSQLPKVPLEIAIGGGNVLEIPEKLEEFLLWCYDRDLKTRLTINIQDINRLYEIGYEYPPTTLERILCIPDAIGVSINSLETNSLKIKEYDSVSYFFGRSDLDYKILGELSNTFTAVYHVIAGVFPYNDLEKLVGESNFPVLILGYKQWGRAINDPLPADIEKFEREVKKLLFRSRSNSTLHKSTICFDNLALEQLHILDSLSPKEIDTYYMGNEGSCSMYIDAVEGKFARTSRDSNRVDWDSINLIDFFKSLRQ